MSRPVRTNPRELGVFFDLGYAACGVSVLEVKVRKVVDHFTIETPRKELLSQRFSLLHRQIVLVISRPGVVVTGYESPLKVGKAKQKQKQTNFNPMLLCKVAGYVESVAWERGLPCYEEDPQAIKRGVLGRGGGTGTKEAVRRAVQAILGIEMRDHEADATATGLVVARKWAVERARAD